jgi:hypothetical protein
MTKKRSLLLTGLFAVSGILPCHARKIFNELPTWGNRHGLFGSLGLPVGNTGGNYWDQSTTDLFNNPYHPTTEEFRKLVNDFNIGASALTGVTMNQPNDGTDLFDVQSAAKDMEEKALSGQTVADVQRDAQDIDALNKSLKAKIELAKQHGIDISNISGSNNRTSKKTDHQASKKSSATRGGSRQRY